jgi:CheY-like chemotaxis protein
MPGGDGVELLRNIKKLHHAVPVVMLITGFSDLSREEAYHLGAEAILAKPFDLDEIDLAVERILTPREVRWASEVDAGKIKRTVEEKFEGFEQALADGLLGLGRGGIFVRLAADYPIAGQVVGLKIQFTSGDLLVIEGSGVVRWARREEAEGLPKGCGIEFESLSEKTSGKILELTSALEPKPFIPKA